MWLSQSGEEKLGSEKGRQSGVGMGASSKRPDDLLGTYLSVAFSGQRLTLNTFLTFLMEELDLEAAQRQIVGTQSQRSPHHHHPIQAPTPAHQPVPLDAALAKHFWKLTALTDGVWEEGKISSSTPGSWLCSAVCSAFFLRATRLVQRALK